MCFFIVNIMHVVDLKQMDALADKAIHIAFFFSVRLCCCTL